MAWRRDSLSKVKVPSDTGVGFVEFESDIAMLNTELAQMVLLLCVKYSRMGIESTEASGVRDERWLEVTWDVVSSALSFGVDGLETVVLFALILVSACVGGVDSTDCVAGSVSERTECPKWTWAVWIGVGVGVGGGHCALGSAGGIGWFLLDRTDFFLGRASLVPLEPFEAMVSSSSAGR